MLDNDLLYAPHRPALQTDLDPVRMGRRLGENLLHNPPGQLARALILLEDDQDGHAGFDGRAGLSVHDFSIAYRAQQVAFSILAYPRKIKHL